MPPRYTLLVIFYLTKAVIVSMYGNIGDFDTGKGIAKVLIYKVYDPGLSVWHRLSFKADLIFITVFSNVKTVSNKANAFARVAIVIATGHFKKHFIPFGIFKPCAYAAVGQVLCCDTASPFNFKYGHE
jgi:hypothetical protein